MSENLPALTLSASDIELVKQTVAKGATDAELRLFLARCQKLGFDPMRPGLIHFVKYSNSPGTIVVGIDGFRSRAASTGKHVGTKRGLMHDPKGNLIGAWCEVYRSDWREPAREEILLAEYSTGKAQWAKMPSTMAKKCAEAAALRIAFPDDLGGIYSDDEMEQARDVAPVAEISKETGQSRQVMSPASSPVATPGPKPVQRDFKKELESKVEKAKQNRAQGGEPENVRPLAPSVEPPAPGDAPTHDWGDESFDEVFSPSAHPYTKDEIQKAHAYVVPMSKACKGKTFAECSNDELNRLRNFLLDKRDAGETISPQADEFLMMAEIYIATKD